MQLLINPFPCLRYAVSFCPTLPEDSDIISFLRALGIDWPTAPANWTNEEREEKIQDSLEKSQYREREMERGRRASGGGGRKAEEGENEGALRINLKQVFQEEGLPGYDPSLGTCTGESECFPPLFPCLPQAFIYTSSWRMISLSKSRANIFHQLLLFVSRSRNLYISSSCLSKKKKMKLAVFSLLKLIAVHSNKSSSVLFLSEDLCQNCLLLSQWPQTSCFQFGCQETPASFSPGQE